MLILFLGWNYVIHNVIGLLFIIKNSHLFVRMSDLKVNLVNNRKLEMKKLMKQFLCFFKEWEDYRFQ